MKSIGLLIFDLDGTLVNTLEDIAASVNYTLGRLGRQPLALDTVRQYVGDGIEALMMRSLGGRTERLSDAVTIYKEHHRQNLVVRSSLYPFVQETLEHFKAIPMAVISNKTMEFVSPLLDRLGINGYFRMVIGADFGLPLKPAPDAVLRLMAEFGVPREQTRDRGRRDHGRPRRPCRGRHHLLRDLRVPLRKRTEAGGAGVRYPGAYRAEKTFHANGAITSIPLDITGP